MSRRLTSILLALVFLLSSEVWAIGLGDINLDSALNEPLRAEIDLLSATPEELSSLRVSLASAETFQRYGIDRPFYLQELQFNVTTGPNGPIVQVRSPSPITEPFLTFLVEAEWSAGRLLREYTVLLDPPTYAPPVVQETPAVQAPRRATPTDSGRIEREPPASRPEPESQTRVTAPTRSEPAPTRSEPAPTPREPATSPRVEPTPGYTQDAGYSTTSGGDVYVNRGDTLWGITQRMRPDSRLTMNQAMLAIYEANRGAFSGNINRLKAGATLRIPSADEVFQISRGTAFAEVKRQNDTWRAEKGLADTGVADTSAEDTSDDAGYADTVPYEDTTDATAGDATYDAGYGAVEQPAEPEPETETSLTLVPPDEEAVGTEYAEDIEAAEPTTREQEIENRITELEAADVPEQPSLIEIRDNELAALRQELAEIRGETAALDDIVADDALPDDEVSAEAETEAAEEAAVEAEPAPTNIVRTPRASEPSLMDRVTDILGSAWLKIIAGAVLLAGVALWFLRRSRGDDDDDSWETLDSDEIAAGAMSATESLQAPRPDESFVVVEQDSGVRPLDDDTVEAPMPEETTAGTGTTGQFDSLEDTFSSETAVNLDQTDPLAEADFHMAYGLYDQAADLINGALESDPNDQALMSKLCEIYFVWGNRDAFIDAATRLKTAVGGGESAEWDKIVIMGQQIAGDDALFAGAGVAGATKAVDLSFESEMDGAGALDMDFGGDDAAADIVDLGAGEPGQDDDGLDFVFDDDATLEASADDEADMEPTAEMSTQAEPTVESPTVEHPFSGGGGTSELPSLADSLGGAIADGGQDAAETAEMNLDDLDLDLDGLDETELASLDDPDATGTNEVLSGDLAEITGKNPEIDPDSTGVQEKLDPGETGIGEALDLDDLDDLDDEVGATGLRLAPDETGRMPMLDAADEADLLDATGHTQILSDDLAVDTATDVAHLKDDDATMLAPADDEDEDFDFAKTEALPPEAFTGSVNLDETSEMPGVAETDVDLDLDDLTAALQVSEAGDTVEQPRDDATVEQPRPSMMDDETAEVPTMALGPEEMSDDLHEARTMTEVGTKLDLARAYVDMGDPQGARSILEEVLDEGDEGQRQQAQQLLDSLPG